MPQHNQIHLKPWMTRTRLHKEYVDECKSVKPTPDPYLCYPNFTRLWKEEFPKVVIPPVGIDKDARDWVFL